ncbi:DUF1223 domain-containing protein [Algirhabdus cladophorae]|uniref:DUF1223 domain-containing protein n=1 Tax=Algirhabdus cladophorae TaxID=3377108 RepID=UPI003B845322
MKKLVALAASAWMATVGLAAADDPVVIELYTSQGCSSCPPADKLLHDLAKSDDIIALALHVDYWDYIGWKDEFANPAFAERQRAYSRVAGKRSVYTPQMVIGGQDHVIGTKPAEVKALLRQHAEKSNSVDLDVTRSGGKFVISARTAQPTRMLVQVVRYTPQSTVAIKRGENAGRTLDYTNVVKDWQVVKKWDGRAPLRLTASTSGADRAVVIIQRDGHREILAAAHLN